VSIDFADRIDIYKSAQPVIFGNMSFGAVNLVPKRIQEEGLLARYRGSFGKYSTLIQQGEFGGRKDRWDFYVTGSYRKSDGHRDNADGAVGQVYGSVGVALTEGWSLVAQLSHSDGWANDPGQVGIAPTPQTEHYETNAQLYLIKLSHRTDKWLGDFKFYYDDGFGDWLQWDRDLGESFRSVTDYDNYGFRFRERYIPWEKGEVLFGYDHDIYGGNFVEKRLGGNRSVTNLNFRNAAPYLMFSHSFGEELSLVPSVGVRFNSSRYFGSNWGPQAGLSLGHQNTKIYANYAHGFNLPGVWSAISYGNWGRGDQWKDLSAETVDHYEIGLAHVFSRQFRTNVSFFHDNVKDALRLVPPPPPPPLFANIGAYESTGGEINLEAMPFDILLLYLGSNYTNTRPSNVPFAPKWTWVGGTSVMSLLKCRI
jgi:iron complex outermembrane receptor protein